MATPWTPTAPERPFHQHLLRSAAPTWQAMLEHPFLRATADGTIPDQVFATWLVQDYLFVRGAIPFMGVLLAKAPPELYAPLADAIVVLNHELVLFRQQAHAHAIDLDQHTLSPTCHAYLQFLLATAYTQPFTRGFTVLYGLERAYLDSWMWVKQHQQARSRWQAFINNWTSDAFRGYVDWLARTLDQQVRNIPTEEAAKLEELFQLTARYEYMFWEMAQREQRWPA
jgi:thiaminase